MASASLPASSTRAARHGAAALGRAAHRVREPRNDTFARTRNVVYARELCGLFVDVPWSSWAGYEDSSESDVQCDIVFRTTIIQGRGF